MFEDGYFELMKKSRPLEAVTSFQAGNVPCDLNEQNPARLRCLRLERNFLETFGITHRWAFLHSRGRLAEWPTCRNDFLPIVAQPVRVRPEYC